LGVTPRTVSFWEAGRTRIPYAAFRLLRVMLGGELPGPAREWEGFFIRGDRLYSPENHGFTAADLSWLSLTFRRSEAFNSLYRQVDQLKAEVSNGRIGRVVAAADAENEEGAAGWLREIAQGPRPAGDAERTSASHGGRPGEGPALDANHEEALRRAALVPDSASVSIH
jgi:hypothetical protein